MAICGPRTASAAVLIRVVFRKMSFSWTFDQVGGALAYACTAISYVLANKMTAAANVILLQYTAPIHAALFGAWFLNERASRLDWATILIALLGMALFFCDRLTATGYWGNIVALGSGLGSFPDTPGWIGLAVPARMRKADFGRALRPRKAGRPPRPPGRSPRAGRGGGAR